MSLRSILLVAALSLGALRPLLAVETSSAEASRDRQTSSLEQVTTKPLMLFVMRQRPDPFMAYALMTVTASADYFNIANLSFSGLIEMEGVTVALFKDNHDQTYTCKGAGLYGPSGQRMPDVKARIGADKAVLLEQGEKKIVYSATITSKRLDSARPR